VSDRFGGVPPSENREAAREFAGLALKYAVMINGGGAVALLAFVGAIWSTGPKPLVVIALTVAIAFFALGVFSAAWAAWTRYQIQNYRHLEAQAREQHHRSAERWAGDFRKLGEQSYRHWKSFLMASFVLFIVGVAAACGSLLLQFLTN